MLGNLTLKVPCLSTCAVNNLPFGSLTFTIAPGSAAAEPGAIVKVKLPNGKLLTAQVDKQGTFNVKLPSKGTFKGGEVLEVSVVDRFSSS